MKVSYLGLKKIIDERGIDPNELILKCQLTKVILHDINTSTEIHPYYVKRICDFLQCQREDIISPFVYEKRAGVFMPWCYDPIKTLRDQLREFMGQNYLSYQKVSAKTGVIEKRIIGFLQDDTLITHEIALLKKLGKPMDKYVDTCLGMLLDMANKNINDAFKTPPVEVLKLGKEKNDGKEKK